MILVMTTMLSPVIRYSTPLKVLDTMLTRAMIAYLSSGSGLSRMAKRKSNFSVSSILKTSLRISS